MYNKIMIMGHVGHNSGVTEVNNAKVLKMSVATTKSYNDKNGERISVTVWHNVVVWGKRADWYRDIQSGDLVMVEGEQQNKVYEKNGVKKYSSQIAPSIIKILNRKSDRNNNSNNNNNNVNVNNDPMDEVPF